MCKDEVVTKGPAETDEEGLVAAVRDRYGRVARQVAAGESGGCGCSNGAADWISRGLYERSQIGEVPAGAVEASLGCGNPTALAELRPGQVVLDLGSGGGIDVLLSARRVGPTGKAYGLDMTDDMLALARENQRKAGITNAEFLKGRIEAIPLPDASVDVVISNCVVNLSVDKPRVFAEAFRVLKPGGLFAVSDILARREPPAAIRKNIEAYLGCFAGALVEGESRRLLEEAGFEAVSVTPTRIYTRDDAQPIVEEAGLDPALADLADGVYMSAFLRARKPEVAADPAPGLDERTKELIAVGSSVAANCLSCLDYHHGKALGAGATREEIAQAISVGRVVRRGAASRMESHISGLGKRAAASEEDASAACGCGS